MTKIKAIITDVDGVMVGAQQGVNFPLPHTDVIEALRRVSQSGVPVVLCTAKFGNAIKDIAVQAGLNNPHITDGGAVIIDWLDKKVVAQQTIDPQAVQEYVQSCIERDIYVELYTADNYYLQHSEQSEFTPRRSKVLQQDPQYVDSLMDFAAEHDIIKIISFSKDDADMPRLEDNVRRFDGKLNYMWTQHPFLVPRRPLIITKPGVSKQEASRAVAEHLGVSLDEILGIGDSESDWSFMQLCGYAATVGTETGNLKQLAQTKGEGNYYFAQSVDDHGLLEIFQHFGLVS